MRYVSTLTLVACLFVVGCTLGRDEKQQVATPTVVATTYEHPTYYVWHTRKQPPWCRYKEGDRISFQFSVVGEVYVITGWHVVPASDRSGRGDAVVRGCGYFTTPVYVKTPQFDPP